MNLIDSLIKIVKIVIVKNRIIVIKNYKINLIQIL